MVTALEAAARRGACAQVWRIAVAALPVLLPAPGVRPRNGLAGSVAPATEAAGGAGRDSGGTRHGGPARATVPRAADPGWSQLAVPVPRSARTR
ncbi:hypothetical protein [Nonomuraea sp. KM90]|uniref:hypothetical protein n=1 Tax=Nonomuraea sp. KM90 TaxID=3457428 RepID=UPI003FCD6BB3